MMMTMMVEDWDPNTFIFAWEGQRYSFEWRQVVLGSSLALLKWVVEREDAIYGYDVFALFQLSGVVPPDDVASVTFLMQVSGQGLKQKILAWKRVLHSPPPQAGANGVLPGPQQAINALFALYNWCSPDPRAVAQYQAARYVHNVAYRRWHANLQLHRNLIFFFKSTNPYLLVRDVYLRFFGQGDAYNETHETIFVLMCRMGTHQRPEVGHPCIDLDYHIYDHQPVWKQGAICRDTYRAIVVFKSMFENPIVPADRLHKRIVLRHRLDPESKYTSREDLLERCYLATGLKLDAVTQPNLRSMFSHFLWCFLVGLYHVQNTVQFPSPYVHFQ